MTALEAYGAAWLENDPTRRLELLDIAWADGAVYCDPLDVVSGREALAEHIGATQAGLAGGRVSVTTEPVHHHDRAFFRWAITDAVGAVLLTGFDVVQLDDGGRICALTGFFDTDTGPAQSER